MEFSPHKFREIVFQLLFSMDASDAAEAELIPFLMRELAVSKKHVSAAYKKALSVWEQHGSLDAIIEKHTQNYSFGRIKSVERSVLRLALYELLIEKSLNTKIIISEAHRLTRKFGTIEGASFVNALLDNLEIDNGPAISSQERDTLK